MVVGGVGGCGSGGGCGRWRAVGPCVINLEISSELE